LHFVELSSRLGQTLSASARAASAFLAAASSIAIESRSRSSSDKFVLCFSDLLRDSIAIDDAAARKADAARADADKRLTEARAQLDKVQQEINEETNGATRCAQT